MTRPDIELTPGTALVIVGPQGSGKNKLAQELAQKAGGRAAHLHAEDLASDFGLGRALQHEPDVCIVEGFPSGSLLPRLKSLITARTVVAHRKYQQPVEVKTPHFIFCTGDVEAVQPLHADRRFRIVHVEAA